MFCAMGVTENIAHGRTHTHTHTHTHTEPVFRTPSKILGLEIAFSLWLHNLQVLSEKSNEDKQPCGFLKFIGF